MLVETTGLADPTPILTETVVRHNYKLDLVVTTVDAMHGLRGEESVKQVAAADRIVLTMLDAVSASNLASVRRMVEALNPSADLIEASFGDIDPVLLLGGGEDRVPEQPFESALHPDVKAHSIYLNEPMSWSAFAVWLTMLLASRGQDVLRVKGLLDVGGSGPVVLNGVQHAIHPPLHLDRWPDDDRRSRLLFITRDIDRGALERSMRAFDSTASVNQGV